MWIRRLGLLLALAVTVAPSWAPAQSAPPPTARQIVVAHDRARAAIESGEGVAEALAILERSGVEAVLADPPDDLSRDRSAEILADYAGYLKGAREPVRRARGDELAAGLPALFRARAQAHLDEGDAALAKHSQDGTAGALAAARGSFLAYLAWLRRAAATAIGQPRFAMVVPQRVSDLVYGPSTRPICDVMASLLRDSRDRDIELFLNPERDEGTYRTGRADPWTRLAGVSDLDAQTLEHLRREAQGGDVLVSRVDMDGDGVDEVRFSIRVGTASCERNSLLRRLPTGAYRRLTGPVWNNLSGGEGARCGGAELSFVHHGRRAYLLDTDENRGELVRGVYSVAGDAIAKQCTIRRRPGPLKVRHACRHGACRLVARNGVRIVAEIKDAFPTGGEALQGVDIDRTAFSPEALRMVTERRFDAWTSIDLDNDGHPELIAWVRGGIGGQLDYAIFKIERDDLLHAVDPWQVWPFWQRIAPRHLEFYGDGGIEFRRFAGKNYIISVRGSRDQARQGLEHDLTIFLLGKGSGQEIGRVRVLADPVITVQP